MTERLQKVLARRGLGSRRHCEDLIHAGRVTVNGMVAMLGDKVDPHAVDIRIDGELLYPPEPHRYIKLHKPPGYLCSTQSQGGHPTIFNLVPIPERIHPVGRLDLDSEGLILLTNNGELTQRLTHPSYQHEKEYRVLFEESPSHTQLSHWQGGVLLPDGYLTKRSHISVQSQEQGQTWCNVILREGRKRQIRTMASVLGLTVLRLIRIRIATLALGSLAPGNWQDCSIDERDALLALLEVN